LAIPHPRGRIHARHLVISGQNALNRPYQSPERERRVALASDKHQNKPGTDATGSDKPDFS